MRMYAHAGALELYARAPGARIPYRINNRVLEFQRAKVRVGDRRMVTAEVTCEGRPGAEMPGPVNFANRAVEPFGIRDVEARQLQKDPVGDPRPQASTVSHGQRPGEGHSSGSLTRVRGAEPNQLARQQVSQPARGADQKSQWLRAHITRAARPRPLTTNRSKSSSAQYIFPTHEATYRAQCPIV